MSITAKAVTAALFIATVATPGLADPVTQRQDAPRAQAVRGVFVCASDAATRRAFERDHGAAPVFITAREAVAANAAGERWSTPRCMTAREHQRYVQLRSSVASR